MRLFDLRGKKITTYWLKINSRFQLKLCHKEWQSYSEILSAIEKLSELGVDFASVTKGLAAV